MSFVTHESSADPKHLSRATAGLRSRERGDCHATAVEPARHPARRFEKVLEMKVKPAVVAFLKERGLELSEEKTHITHIDDGFDFLGFNVRKYAGKLLIKPAKAAVRAAGMIS